MNAPTSSFLVLSNGRFVNRPYITIMDLMSSIAASGGIFFDPPYINLE